MIIGRFFVSRRDGRKAFGSADRHGLRSDTDGFRWLNTIEPAPCLVGRAETMQ
jgi:hypothetical protein